MAKRQEKTRKGSADERDDEGLDLTRFQSQLNDHGVSLERLSDSMESVLEKGSDPYTENKTSDGNERWEAAEPVSRAESDLACPISPRSIVEAMLFVGHPSDDPITSEQIAALMRGVRASEVDALIEELNDSYDQEGSPYGIEAIGGGYRLSLRPEYDHVREQFYGKIREAKLSQAAIDVLAIVAYNQPLSRAAVEEIRGDECGRLLSQLVRRELIRIERTQDKPTSTLYRTTARFLTLFGLSNLNELPQSQDFDRR